VLVADDGLQQPQRQNLTPRTQAFFDFAFAPHPVAHGSSREPSHAPGGLTGSGPPMLDGGLMTSITSAHSRTPM
jgi:hypothetical protein